MLVFYYQGSTGFRWPIAYYPSCTAKAHELYVHFWKAVDALDDHGFTINYCIMDGASTNRALLKMHFTTSPIDCHFIMHSIYDPAHKIVFLQDIMHTIKKI